MAKRKSSKKQKDDEEDDFTLSDTTALAVQSGSGMELYLADSSGEPVILALVPPDMERCQCEWPDTTTSTFGPKPMVRCGDEPTVVAFQKRVVNDATPTGAMSLCDDHKVMIEHMYPNQCYFRRINSEKKIGDFV